MTDTAGAAPVNGARIPARSYVEKVSIALIVVAGILIALRPFSYDQTEHLFIAPFFYVFIGRRWGPYAGLIAAAALGLLAVHWWDAWWFVTTSMCSFLCIHLLRRRGLRAAESIALFNVAAVPLLIWQASWSQMPHPMIFLLGFQYAMGQILSAALADLLIVNYIVVARFPFLVPRPSRSIDRIIRTTVNAMVAFGMMVSVTNEAGTRFDFEQQTRELPRAAAIAAVRGAIDAGKSKGEFDRTAVTAVTAGAVRILFSDATARFAGRAIAAMATDCRWPFDIAIPHSQEHRYATWIGSCELIDIVHAGRPVAIAVAYKPNAGSPASWLGDRLLLIVLAAALALAYRISLSRALARTIAICEEFVDRFGTPNLPLPQHMSITEADSSLRRFVERNNSFVAAIEDRERLTCVAIDLKRSVDLQLMGDISFDAGRGILSFTEVRLSMPPIKREIQVHAADCPLFTAAAGNSEATIEFRTASWQNFDSLLITVRQNAGGTAWDTGVMVKLSQPRRLRDLMVQQARLVDLGSMASAISHEIKQPLFTIAIAAESLQLMLDKSRSDLLDEQVSTRIRRIHEQVDRAREIIERISQYGRTDASTPSEIDAGEVMRVVHSFLSAMLDERHIAVTTDIAAGSNMVLMSRIALEQVIVNAVQNAADSIEARRDSGWTGEGHILLRVSRAGNHVRCIVGDNGSGLGVGVSEAAFNAFFTTKPADKGSGLGLFISRQIAIEAGGRIRLLAGEEEGAVVELDLPHYQAGQMSDA